MRKVFISIITAMSLLIPIQSSLAVDKKNTCSKSNLNKVKNNLVCTKSGKSYKWVTKKNTTKDNVANTPKINVIDYLPPTQPSSNIELCQIRQINSTRYGATLPTGFPDFTIANKTGTVKWALIPIDFQDLPGEENFRSRVDDQMKLLSDWFATVSEGKFKVEWVVANNWVRLPNPTNQYAIDNSNNLDRVPNGTKLWNDAMIYSDKVFDFTGIQTVNFILPKGQTFLKETLQGFPWDPGVKSLITNEGSVSSFSIPGKFMDQPGRQYWSYWAHEFGHAMALPHIGSSREPNPFLGLDIMGSQDGESRELSGWMRFVAGWLSNEKVYCQELNKLVNTEITLIPLSETNNGIKMVIIPVSTTKAVIIESRRETKFSCIVPSKRNGILTYTYDALLNHAENFLKPIVPEGRAIEGSMNCLVTPYPNPILYKGQKINIEGISIEVLDSLNYDKVKISKINN